MSKTSAHQRYTQLNEWLKTFKKSTVKTGKTVVKQRSMSKMDHYKSKGVR
jgi:hypothetical protein